MLEQLLYLWIDDAASGSERDRTVNVACRPDDLGGVVEVAWTPKPAEGQPPEQKALLDALANELQGEVTEGLAADGTYVRTITLPQMKT